MLIQVLAVCHRIFLLFFACDRWSARTRNTPYRFLETITAHGRFGALDNRIIAPLSEKCKGHSSYFVIFYRLFARCLRRIDRKEFLFFGGGTERNRPGGLCGALRGDNVLYYRCKKLQFVYVRELLFQIRHVLLRTEGSADGLEEGHGVLHAAVLPDLLLQPAIDGGELAGADGGLHIQILLHLQQILCAVGRADGVGGTRK